MARSPVAFRCTGCAAAAPRWAGRCPSCGEWNTLAEEPAHLAGGRPGTPGPAGRALPISHVDMAEWSPVPTGVRELDRVLGGGLVPGSVTLLGGEPGIGKSTLLLQALGSLAARGARCLLVSAEESNQQVRLRAARLGTLAPDLWLLSDTALPGMLTALDDVKPDVAVLDSIQSVFDPEVGSAPGSVTQVRECAQRLVAVAKDRALALVLVGHVTKDGALAGPRVLEHVVDTVLSFEGDRHHALRLLRAVKHRFGPTGELGLFQMAERGLDGVPDAAGLLLGDRRLGVAGSVVVPAMEGQRCLLVELQALVHESSLAMARRSAQGLDGGRLALMLAVLHRRAGVGLGRHDVYASAVGGVRISEPATDLAVALALASAVADRPFPGRMVACGEIGLAGELRQVGHMGRRLAEAARLGFTGAVVPASAADGPAGMELVRVGTLAEAVRAFGFAQSH